MEKLDFQFELDEKQQRCREQMIETLKNDPDIKGFLLRNKLPETILEKEPTRFKRFIKGREQCRDCAGLDFCVMKIRGQQLDLQVDLEGFLNEVYVPCRYLDERTAAMAHRGNFTVSHMKDQDYLVNFEELSETLDDEPAAYLLAFSRAMSSANSSTGCMFYGQPGTGKSTLMMAIANQLAKEGKKVAFVRVPLLMSELKENLSDDLYRRRILGRLRFAEVLFLDDFGSEMATPWTRDEILFPLLDERMNAKRKTYFASNINPDDLITRYSLEYGNYNDVASKRLVERVRALSSPIEVKGNSRRKSPDLPPVKKIVSSK